MAYGCLRGLVVIAASRNGFAGSFPERRAMGGEADI